MCYEVFLSKMSVVSGGTGMLVQNHHIGNNMNMHGSNMTKPAEPDPSSVEYLAQLIKDKQAIAMVPNMFRHLERLLDEEISKVRVNLFKLNNSKPLELPAPDGPTMTLSEKLYVPVKEHPDFNFVGRILGPRGMTAKQLEAETGCKIMVRGKGSMRDKKKEEQNRGKPNWEHLNDELHVLITVEDCETRARIKLQRAVEEVKKLLVPSPEGEDDLKKRQLMELAILNGTYRDNNTKNMTSSLPSDLALTAPSLYAFAGTDQKAGLTLYSPRGVPAPNTPMVAPPTAVRSPMPAGAPLIATPVLQRLPSTQQIMSNGLLPHMMSPESNFLYTPYDYPYSVPASSILQYPIEPSEAIGRNSPYLLGAVTKARRHVVRDHPYQRAVIDRGATVGAATSLTSPLTTTTVSTSPAPVTSLTASSSTQQQLQQLQGRGGVQDLANLQQNVQYVALGPGGQLMLKTFPYQQSVL
ncbi:protein quaking-like isoform X3 [Branchiostoma floridae]|uniref:Protein quaking-like isoform X3 n=1 Tax=Branchiostoma floridae TaxID=7739 RepID=A0A9J7MY46_BRAFL|nr:protein quaking-like isoform X3 [Branchiostoma floridae]